MDNEAPTVEAKVDLHEMYERLDGDAMKAAASAAARAGNDAEAAFWLNALNVWSQAKDKKAEWRKSAEREIGLIKDKLVEALSPVKVYLFGSFADGRAREDSDFDFYVVVKDDEGGDFQSLFDLTVKAHEAAHAAFHPAQTRPIDIVVGTESGFENGKGRGLKREVAERGVLLYG